MRVLLGSGGFRTPERIGFLREQMRAFFGGVGTLLFVPHALKDHDGYVQIMRERGLDAGYRLVGLHTCRDPVAAIGEAEGLFVGGGNTFRLLSELYRLDLLGTVRRRVREGMPYLGVSAGCNVACPTMKTTNDMPITQPPSGWTVIKWCPSSWVQSGFLTNVPPSAAVTFRSRSSTLWNTASRPTSAQATRSRSSTSIMLIQPTC